MLAEEHQTTPRDSSNLSHSPPHLQRQSSDFEIAQQLVQHSQAAREGNGDGAHDGASGPKSPADLTTDVSFPAEAQNTSEGENEQGHREGQSPSQDRQSDLHYAPISSQPVMGQICR